MTSQLNRAIVLASAASVLLLLTAGVARADCPGEIKPSSDNPLQMLVIGDSILWGQGLKPEQKAWWRVKCWLQETTGRQVTEKIEAHSGALIEGGSSSTFRFKSNDGEVNLPYPTVNEQLDHAVDFYGADRSKVNLILVDGCINDIDVSNLLNAAATPEGLRERVTSRCGEGMHNLLRRVTENFPNAYVLVTGYYRIISSDTADNAFLRLLVKQLNNQRPEARHMTDKQMRERLITLSDVWYKVSTASLSQAVSKVNAELSERSLPPRVMFVEIEFWPEHSFSASESLLWNFMFGATNLSGFRKVIVALSFGTAAYKANDVMRESRVRSCNETYKAPGERKETDAEKSDRKDRLLVCRYASLGHPDQMGAMIYTEAIKGKLQWLLDRAGWKTNTSTPLFPQ
jgi:hypothetical protein